MLQRFAVLGLSAILFTGCYHATIETGLAPSTTTISKPWAHGFLYGLVPPSTIETASKCPNGVAKVETRLSFLNQLASALAFGFYSPMQIDVTCAAAGSASRTVDARGAVERALQEAIELSRDSGEPVAVQF